uniref:Uncharacterized protein involved in tolerance to divalent cations-like protein n=1 Tax=Chlorobium chlorochromatii (strain CaD3) TaxID=340177 RepID=Q3APT5_CHLCH
MDSATYHCMVITTLPNRPQAEQLAELLLTEHVAACIQMVDIRSIYLWQTELCNEPEVLLLIKTTESAYPNLEGIITQNHPYEIPEIIKLPIHGGSTNYLNWLTAMTTGCSTNKENARPNNSTPTS